MTTFPSRRDAWLLALVGVGFLGTVISMFGLLSSSEPAFVRYGLPALMVATFAFVGWIFASTRYELTDTTLTARSGPLQWHVALDQIEEVYPTRNPLSAPALSIHRLGIRVRGGGLVLLISPADRDGFLAELVRRTPGLVKDGDRYHRA
ncbi:MAG: PH domain-containing protein [Rhodothermales bacterium]